MTFEKLVEYLYENGIFYYTDSDLLQFMEEQDFEGDIQDYIHHMQYNIIHQFEREGENVYAFLLD